MKATLMDAMDVNERINLRFPFSAEVETGETISSVQILCTVESGTDATPALLLVGSPTIVTATSDVLQTVQGRVAAVTYKIKCIATLSSGRKLARVGRLPVVDY